MKVKSSKLRVTNKCMVCGIWFNSNHKHVYCGCCLLKQLKERGLMK